MTGIGLTPETTLPVPDEAFRDLIDSAHTSPATRRVMSDRLGRAQAWIDTPRFFTSAEFRTLRALAECIVPGAGVDLAAGIDAQLAANKGDGWRYGLLPPDPEAWRCGLLSLNLAARRVHNLPFLSLYPDQQHALLARAAEGNLGHGLLGALHLTDAAEAYSAENMKQWFEDVRGEITRCYMADPRAMQRVGYTGFADDLGFKHIQLGEVEAFER